jgi:hypothetical protein
MQPDWQTIWYFEIGKHKTSMHQPKYNVMGLSKIAVNAARLLEQT